MILCTLPGFVALGFFVAVLILYWNSLSSTGGLSNDRARVTCRVTEGDDLEAQIYLQLHRAKRMSFVRLLPKNVPPPIIGR
jgi:hypothetical protein